MRFDTDTLERRKPVWLGLSGLFLDSQLQDSEIAFIAQKMKQSDYGLDQLSNILMQEVFPVCIPNLHSVAGEWAGFNEDWLVEKITGLKPPNVFQRWFYRKNFWMIKDEWERVVDKFKNTKSGDL